MGADATLTAAAVPTLEGGCLCGRVRYRLQPGKLEGYYCHCRMCQLAVGNTRAAFINTAASALQWTASPPAWYASSKLARRAFCGHCGTPLAFRYNDSERIDMTIGSLDAPARVRPGSHFAVETRIESWHAEDGLPGTRLDEHQRLMQRWRHAYGEAEPGLATVRTAVD